MVFFLFYFIFLFLDLFFSFLSALTLLIFSFTLMILNITYILANSKFLSLNETSLPNSRLTAGINATAFLTGLHVSRLVPLQDGHAWQTELPSKINHIMSLFSSKLSSGSPLHSLREASPYRCLQCPVGSV